MRRSYQRQDIHGLYTCSKSPSSPSWSHPVVELDICTASTMRRLFSVVQPRLTWSYVFCSVAITYASYCFFHGLPLFSTPLPAYTGPHAVGAIDIEVPVEPRDISDIRIKVTDQRAFQVFPANLNQGLANQGSLTPSFSPFTTLQNQLKQR